MGGGGRGLRLEWDMWSNAAARTDFGSCCENTLGSCRLEKYPWEVDAWENTLGSCRLGKYPWEVVVRKNTL